MICRVIANDWEETAGLFLTKLTNGRAIGPRFAFARFRSHMRVEWFWTTIPANAEVSPRKSKVLM